MKTIYQCECCGEIYNKESSAIECENSYHDSIVRETAKIIDFKFKRCSNLLGIVLVEYDRPNSFIESVVNKGPKNTTEKVWFYAK